jgi:hypothetical protein
MFNSDIFNSSYYGTGGFYDSSSGNYFAPGTTEAYIHTPGYMAYANGMDTAAGLPPDNQGASYYAGIANGSYTAQQAIDNYQRQMDQTSLGYDGSPSMSAFPPDNLTIDAQPWSNSSYNTGADYSSYDPSADYSSMTSTDAYDYGFFATGGSFRVGSTNRRGGIDSQLVQFHATPGEQVSVTRPGSYGGPDIKTIGGGNEITLKLKSESAPPVRFVASRSQLRRVARA